MGSTSTRAMLLLLAAVLISAMTADAKTAAAAPPVDCTSVVLSMADCLSYVTNGSTTEKPEGGCCSGLKQVLKTNPECLCQAFQQSSQFGVVLNVTKALALPSACGVHAPSATKCGLSVTPASAPAGAVVAPAGGPSFANAPSDGIGSSETATPVAAPPKNGSSSSIGVSALLIIAGLATAFITSF
ncbi:non-specific lipid transfer protein GPI-anchored 31-like [Silene latifolia]|uniref:non-specific lipid transfer protein GPI-anchored 31-like n=1 Tax=Silene latifolia TaxID=37657 RepID=UPI003D78AFCB